MEYILLPLLAISHDATDLKASPSAGRAPLAVVFTGTDNGVTYFGGVRLNFGDGETAVFCSPGGSCGEKKIAHTYRAGTYKAQLIGFGEPSPKLLGEMTIDVH